MKSALTLGFALALSALPSAQWSTDAALNQRLSDGDGDEVQSKVRVGTDGFAFVSWFDSDPDGTPAFGYDVRLQRLDPSGNEQWAAGGITVADRGYSSTQDYGMDAGFNSDGFVAFRDDRFGGTQITASRVDANGVQVWGATGVQLTNTTAFLAAPKIAAMPNGDCVVAWTQDSTVRIQRLSPAGATVWIEAAAIPVAAGETASLSDLRASDLGSVILSYVSQTGGFFGPRHLKARKINSNGTPGWIEPVTVYSAGSLQIANFPEFSTDGSGGAIFSWYDTSLQCFAQHLNTTGAPLFPVNGVAVSNNAVRQRVSPYASYNASTQELYVFWTELAASQSQRGLTGQKFNAAGVPQWTAEGINFVPVSATTDVGFVRTVQASGNTSVVWFQNSGFGTDVVNALNVDASGTLLNPISTIASTLDSKGRLGISAGPLGDVYAAWHDNRTGDNDLYVQNVRADGGVGPQAGSLTRNEGTNFNSYTASVGPIGGALDLAIDLTTSGHQFGFFLMYVAPASVPFGTDVVLVDLFAPPGNLLKTGIKAGPIASLSLTIPNDPNLIGAAVYTQGVHVDTVLPLRMSNAEDIYLGL
ncbi:MAG: hypothetical protein ACI87A_001940 [Planctomycetota bacterium]|jgi:hypothetical protein